MMAFERLEPFGVLPKLHAVAQVSAILANVNRDPEARGEPFTAADFCTPVARALDGYSDILNPEPEGDGMTDEQRSALLDAVLFGKA